jgi:hypothetical protein
LGFELRASADQATSQQSEAFDIVDQIEQCKSGQTCKTKAVSAAGTSGSEAESTQSTSNVLTATAGLQSLSCTTKGGVLAFTAANGSTVITLTLAKSASAAKAAWGSQLGICWGSTTPFTTADGSTSKFYPADDLYEGLLPSSCMCGKPQPCVASQYTKSDGAVVTTVAAPSGDPLMSY